MGSVKCRMSANSTASSQQPDLPTCLQHVPTNSCSGVWFLVCLVSCDTMRLAICVWDLLGWWSLEETVLGFTISSYPVGG